MPHGALTGSRIRDRRIATGMKQADLARAVGISASYLNLIEHNRRRIGGKLVADLARALGVEVTALTEGAEAVLLATLREAASGGGADPGDERAEEFAGRFPGWARVLAERHARVERLERRVEALSDRMAHDPQLSASLHELLTAVTAIRSSTSILARTEDLDPAWVKRFLNILDAEGRRLAEGAEELAHYLDGPGAAEPSAVAPQEEVESMFAARDWYLPELEAGAGAGAVDALVSGAAELTSAAGRALARSAALRYADVARILPAEAVAPVAAEGGVEAVMAAFGASAAMALRRLAFLPGREAGVVVADAAGAILQRRPIAGFAMPRYGVACPLWPVFQALSQPGVPISVLVEMPGAGARRMRAEAVAAPVSAPFGASPVFEAVMLLTPDRPGGATAPVQVVGPTCRVCPREPCPARREPSILGPAPR